MRHMASKDTPQDLYQQEAERLAALTARERKAAIAVHRRIADDHHLSSATRNHAQTVADALENLIAAILHNRKHSS